MAAGLQQIKHHAACIVAVALLATLTVFCQLPNLSAANLADLASSFRFTKSALPLTADHPSFQYDRRMHPSLQRVSAWMAALGAAVTLADLDGDGLPNDYILVDSRTDLVTVGPVPGSSGDRYKPFALSFASLKNYNKATMAPMGTVACDFNEDGQQDILVYFWGRPPVLLLKKTPAQAASKICNDDYVAKELITQPELWSTCAVTVADLDGDGHQDIIVGNYFPDGAPVLDGQASGTITMMESNSHACNGGKKHFFLWKSASKGASPDVQFNEVTNVLDTSVSCGWTLAMAACDLNGDNLPEVYIANDVGPDRLLQNNSTPGKLSFSCLTGRGNFSDPTAFVLGEDPFKGMGVDFADINGDGIPDIYVSNIAQPWGLQESHFMFVSQKGSTGFKDGIAPYSQESENLGLSRGGWAWDCRLADFNNDGVLEAIQAKGFVKGTINRWPEAQSLATCNNAILSDPHNWPAFLPGADISGDNANSFYVRAKNHGRFYDLASDLGLDDRLLARGIAIADVDGDGRLDFAVANQWNPSYFFHNTSPEKNAFMHLYLTLPIADQTASSTPRVAPGHPTAGVPYRPAIGAKATVHLPDGSILVGQVDGGSGHSGKRSTDLHFGLAATNAETMIPIDLTWRDNSGTVQKESISLKPGVYTILLDKKKEAATSHD